MVFLNTRQRMGGDLALGRCHDPGPHGGKLAALCVAPSLCWRLARQLARREHCSDVGWAGASRQIGYWDSTESAKDLRVTGSEYVRGNVTLTNGARSRWN